MVPCLLRPAKFPSSQRGSRPSLRTLRCPGVLTRNWREYTPSRAAMQENSSARRRGAERTPHSAPSLAGARWPELRLVPRAAAFARRRLERQRHRLGAVAARAVRVAVLHEIEERLPPLRHWRA